MGVKGRSWIEKKKGGKRLLFFVVAEIYPTNGFKKSKISFRLVWLANLLLLT